MICADGDRATTVRTSNRAGPTTVLSRSRAKEAVNMAHRSNTADSLGLNRRMEGNSTQTNSMQADNTHTQHTNQQYANQQYTNQQYGGAQQQQQQQYGQQYAQQQGAYPGRGGRGGQSNYSSQSYGAYAAGNSGQPAARYVAQGYANGYGAYGQTNPNVYNSNRGGYQGQNGGQRGGR
eukprot:1064564_1